MPRLFLLREFLLRSVPELTNSRTPLVPAMPRSLPVWPEQALPDAQPVPPDWPVSRLQETQAQFLRAQRKLLVWLQASLVLPVRPCEAIRAPRAAFLSPVPR